MSVPDLYAVADFCLIPIGTASTSVAEEVAECQRILAQSGLTYKVRNVRLLQCHPQRHSVQMHGYGTNIEGPWSQVSKAIHDCHAAVHAKGAQRIATDIRIGTRIDREIPAGQGNDLKVTRVESILAQETTK
ncbi:YkoF-like protein [Pholiota molesta]|nr:YkoF-like protein [Pholiota molesta]